MFEESVLKRIQVMEQSGVRIVGDKINYIDPIKIVGTPHDADLMNAEQAAALAAAIAPHTVIPIHYGKLLGGANAAERFRAALNSRIEAEIRPEAFSTVMISMHLRIAVLIPLCCVLGYFIGKML